MAMRYLLPVTKITLPGSFPVVGGARLGTFGPLTPFEPVVSRPPPALTLCDAMFARNDQRLNKDRRPGNSPGMKIRRHRSRNALLAAAFAVTSVGALASNTAHAYLTLLDEDGVLLIVAINQGGEDLYLWSNGSSGNFYLWADGQYAATYSLDDYYDVALLGSTYDDVLTCDLPIKCTLYGEGGNDSISARPHYMEGTQQYPETFLFGGEDDDYIVPKGPATVEGEDGDDHIVCNDSRWVDGSACTVYGGGDDDTIIGNGGDDTLYGGSGNDVIVGGGGTDQIFGEGDDDTLSGDFSSSSFDLCADEINGGPGIDTIKGLGASDIVTEVEIF